MNVGLCIIIRNINVFLLLLILIPEIAFGQETGSQSDKDLLKESQNPVADLISFPIQSDTFFGLGPFDRTQQVFQLKFLFPKNKN